MKRNLKANNVTISQFQQNIGLAIEVLDDDVWLQIMLVGKALPKMKVKIRSNIVYRIRPT